MSKARDLANLGSNTAALATDAEVSSAVAPKADTTTVNAALATKADTSAVIANSLVDAKGDLLTATAADTPARLAVGSNDQVLTADSTTATGLKWAAVNANSITLLSTTTVSGTSTTVTGISASYTRLMILVTGISLAADGTIQFRFNNSAGTAQTLQFSGTYRSATSSAAATGGTATLLYSDGQTANLGNIASGTTANAALFFIDNYTDTATDHPFTMCNQYFYRGQARNETTFVGGAINAGSAIAQFNVTSSQTMSNGSIKIYGVK